MRARWITIGVTLGLFVACVPGAAAGAAPVLPGFGPPRAAGRPDACRRTPRSTPARTSPPRFDAVLKDDPDVERWSTYVGRGAIRFYLPLERRSCRTTSSARRSSSRKDVAARERLQQKLEKMLAKRLPEPRRPRLSARARAAGRLARAVSRERAGPRRRCGRSRLKLAQAVAANRRCRRRSISTGSSRRGKSACRSTRTRRGGSASARRRWPACSTRCLTGTR